MFNLCFIRGYYLFSPCPPCLRGELAVLSLILADVRWEDSHGRIHSGIHGRRKGKTTAALGLAVRAAGANWNVFFGQFCKGMHTSELAALQERFADRITIHQFGMPRFIIGRSPRGGHRLGPPRTGGSSRCRHVGQVLVGGTDEANVAIKLKLFSVEDMLSLIDAKLPEVELVLTGRDAIPASWSVPTWLRKWSWSSIIFSRAWRRGRD